MKQRISEFIKSIFAGAMISLGGIAYLSCENKVVGAFLFSTGLVCVVSFGFNLYTGKVGYLLDNDRLFFVDTLLSIVGNFVGCLVIGLMKSPIGSVVTICDAKLQKSFGQLLVDGILCGLLIFLCVDIYKKKNTYLGILLCIPTFILCGFEHSVADMFYFVNAGVFSLNALGTVLIVVLGNAIGGLAIPVGMKISYALSKKA